jgi:hypothetical protein
MHIDTHVLPRYLSSITSADETGGKKAGTNYRDPAVQKGSQASEVLHMFLYLSVVLLVSILQINPFRPSPSHPSTDSQSFRFCVNIFSQSTLGGRKLENFFVNRGQNPQSAAR